MLNVNVGTGTTPLKNRSGVYMIRNKINGKRYIGSSVDLHQRRMVHFGSLRKGCHANIHLQRAFIKHGETAFEFHILLDCEPALTLEYEQRILDELKPEYNIALDAVAPMKGRKQTAETRAQRTPND